MRWAAILLLAITSCNSFEGEYAIERDLQIYVEAFYREAGARGVVLHRENLVVMVREGLEANGSWGLSKRNGRQRIVYIDAGYYDDMLRGGHTDRVEFLVFHELGHALLGRHHISGVASVMNPQWHDYSDHRNEFLNELFLQ